MVLAALIPLESGLKRVAIALCALPDWGLPELI